MNNRRIFAFLCIAIRLHLLLSAAQRLALPARAGCLDRLDNRWRTKPPGAESAFGADAPKVVRAKSRTCSVHAVLGAGWNEITLSHPETGLSASDTRGVVIAIPLEMQNKIEKCVRFNENPVEMIAF
jgi:hypothetical protein